MVTSQILRKLRHYLGVSLGRPVKLAEETCNFIKPGSLASWYLSVLNYQSRLGARYGYGPFGNHYEFGVGPWTTGSYIRALLSFCRTKGYDPYRFRVFGFDSFQGLPKSQSQKDKNPDWNEGKFRKSPKQMYSIIKRAGLDPTGGSVRFFQGFFKDTLTVRLRHQLKQYPPSIVTVDVDYYTSTKTILNWIRPLLRSGVVFYFDDIWSFHGNPHYGELAAIAEFNKSHQDGLISFPILGQISYAYIYWKKRSE